jgi:aspartyl-tRNA(Asn)/glutamyl-tRNA(Gln) amidotransferase subunit C
MAITVADVERVALLARLQLTQEELASMTNELARVVDYVDQLAQVDTTGIEPMAHAIEVANVLRDDELVPSLERRDALLNAPNKNEKGFLVPPVLGD